MCGNEGIERMLDAPVGRSFTTEARKSRRHTEKTEGAQHTHKVLIPWFRGDQFPDACSPSSQFTITGTLKRYDVTSLLGSIRVPTLYTVGEFDEADPPTIRHFAELTPHAEVVVLRGAAHLTSWDARDENVRVVRDFLRRCDRRKERP